MVTLDFSVNSKSNFFFFVYLANEIGKWLAFALDISNIYPISEENVWKTFIEIFRN